MLLPLTPSVGRTIEWAATLAAPRQAAADKVAKMSLLIRGLLSLADDDSKVSRRSPKRLRANANSNAALAAVASL